MLPIWLFLGFAVPYGYVPFVQEADKKAKEKAKRERAAAKKDKVGVLLCHP